MKKTGVFLIISLLIASCASPEKLLQRGDYDGVVDKSVKNLIKNPNSSEDAELLDKAYKLANDRDLNRIKYLKMEGNPNTWDEVLNLYGNLKNRQASVSRVLPLHIGNQTIQYEYVDYDYEIVEAKKKAAEYFYNHGQELMENKNKESYRQAYYELVKARNYSGGSYRNVDQMIEEAKYMGTSRALISVVNQTIINLPQEFTDGLIAVNSSQINTEWVEYYTRKPDESIRFDYYIDIILKVIDVSPDVVNEVDRIEKKTIEDGFEYVLDEKGNVMKDTAGNDIKIKKYKDIQCTVIESVQQKDCRISGEVEFNAVNPQTLLKRQPVAAGIHFEHKSARAIGDINALSAESKQLVEIEPVPFTADIQMIIDCTETLKNSIHEAITYNRRIIQ